MSRYSTRGFPPPPDDPAEMPPDRRVFKEQVSVGTPLRIRGDAELRRDIETSLEALAKQRLLEAEENADILMAQARKGAAEVLEKAANQVQDMLSRVQAQVDGIRENSQEDGFKAGFQEGYEEGLAQASAEAVVMLQSAHTLTNAAWQAQKRTLEAFESQMLAMLAHLGRKILGRELEHSPEAVIRLLRQATESLYLSGKTKVVVHPEVLQTLREFDTATRDALESAHRFEFIADPSLDPGQIYIISQEGCFDLSPDTQTDRLLEAVRPHVRLPRPSEEELEGMFLQEEPPLPTLPLQEGGEPDSGLIPEEGEEDEAGLQLPQEPGKEGPYPFGEGA